MAGTSPAMMYRWIALAAAALLTALAGLLRLLPGFLLAATLLLAGLVLASLLLLPRLLLSTLLLAGFLIGICHARLLLGAGKSRVRKRRQSNHSSAFVIGGMISSQDQLLAPHA
jgi:hypothetical protein